MTSKLAQSFRISLIVLAAAGGASVVAGCASAPSRFYTLESTATARGAPAVDGAILVGPVSVPATVDRPEFVVQVAPNRVTLDEFNRWAAPLEESIPRVVAGDLAVLLDTQRVASGPVANFDPTYRVTIDVQRFDSIQGKEIRFQAVWVVTRKGGADARPGYTLVREPVHGDGFEAIAAAHSRALATMSAGIAAAIREEAGK